MGGGVGSRGQGAHPRTERACVPFGGLALRRTDDVGITTALAELAEAKKEQGLLEANASSLPVAQYLAKYEAIKEQLAAAEEKLGQVLPNIHLRPRCPWSCRCLGHHEHGGVPGAPISGRRACLRLLRWDERPQGYGARGSEPVVLGEPGLIDLK